MDSLARNEAYKLLVQLTIEVEQSQACWVTNLNPRAWPKPSAQEVGMKLTSTNPCSCLLLTQIPQRNHSRMERGEWESSFLAWEGVQLVKMGKRGWLKGYGGVLIPLSLKLAVGRRVTRKLRVYARKLRANLFFRKQLLGHSGQWDPEYPALYPKYSGKAGKISHFALLSRFCGSQMFV